MFAYLIHRTRSALKYIRDGTIVPAVCFSDCNNAFIEAQKQGKSAVLCDPNGAFQKALASCAECMDKDHDNASTYLDPNLLPFIDFCAVQGPGATAQLSTITSLLIGGSTLVVTSSSVVGLAEASSRFSQALASFSSQLSSLDSLSKALQYSATKTVEPHTTTVIASQTVDSGGAITTGPSGSPPPSAPLPNTEKPRNHNWIAGAVIGPVLLLLTIVVAIFLVRRRRRGRIAVHTVVPTEEKEDDNFSDYKDKPQLHSDSIPRKASPKPAELPVLEFPASELPAREPVGRIELL